MKKAIITGGTGFIGSWLVSELLSEGYKVILIVRNPQKLLPEYKSNSNCEIINKDIFELNADDFLEDVYDVFYHLAWDGVGPEKKNDIELQINNVTNSVSLLELSKAIRCKLFIAAGTVAEYAFCRDVMDVNARQTPNDIYGAAKTSAHYFLEVVARQKEQNFIWCVLPSTFGERRVDNNIITYTIRSLLAGEKPQYGELSQMWDFLYVSEVVKALRLIGEKGKTGKVYGIGSGQYKPLRVYIERIRDLINPELPLGIGEIPSMSKQTFSSCVNIYDLVLDTGFAPVVDFDEGIRRTINYLRGLHIAN